MKRKNKNKILSGTTHKTIIRHGELVKVLNDEEIQQWHSMLQKVREYDAIHNNGEESE